MTSKKVEDSGVIYVFYCLSNIAFVCICVKFTRFIDSTISMKS